MYGSTNQPPTPVIAPLDASYPEGAGVVLDGSGSRDPDGDPLTYRWLFGDGLCALANPPGECARATTFNRYADDGTYYISLGVNDGLATAYAIATATITNVAPTVTAPAGATVDEGVAWTARASFQDPGADSWTARVDYGDGAGPQAVTPSGDDVPLYRVYRDNGVYTVTIEVTDDDNGAGSDALTLTALNVAPAVGFPPAATVVSGLTFDFMGSFKAPGVLDAPWSWILHWGFGTATTGSTSDQSRAISASRRVCAAGDYTVTLTVTDKDGGAGSSSTTLTVPYFGIDLIIRPGSEPNPVNLVAPGLLPVAVLSTATFDARTLDPATALVGDEAGTDTPVAQAKNGRVQSEDSDVNRDGWWIGGSCSWSRTWWPTVISRQPRPASRSETSASTAARV